MDRYTVIALDIGTKRIGVAIADLELRFANPLMTISQDETTIDTLKSIVAGQKVAELVIGLPRGLDGQETAQTEYVRDFSRQLEAELDLNCKFQDEAATSIKAEAALRSRGKPYEKGDIDALAATYILEDYLLTLGGTNGV